MDRPSDRAPGAVPPSSPTPVSVSAAGTPAAGTPAEFDTLEARLADQRPPDIARAVEILRDVAAALDEGHRHGIVHGNIAPARVLIGERGHVTISDTGLSPAPEYKAPEQWRGEASGPRTDQYALGVMAFQMLTGQLPFEGTDTQDLMRLHSSATVPRAAALRKGVSPAMDAALRRAMAKVPELRFPTAGAFVDALSGDHPISISLDSIEAIRTAEDPGAGRSALAVGAAAAVVIGVAVIAFGVHRGPGPRLPPRAIQPPQPTSRGSAPTLPATPAMTTAQPVPAADSAAPAPAPEGPAVPNGPPLDAAAPDIAAAAPPRAQPPGGSGAFIRVIVRGGVAAVRVDGRTYGLSPAVVNVDPGTHVVTVDGAGDAFLPSQHVVAAIARDTTQAVFVPRIHHADAGAPDSLAAPPDTAR